MGVDALRPRRPSRAVPRRWDRHGAPCLQLDDRQNERLNRRTLRSPQQHDQNARTPLRRSREELTDDSTRPHHPGSADWSESRVSSNRGRNRRHGAPSGGLSNPAASSPVTFTCVKTSTSRSWPAPFGSEPEARTECSDRATRWRSADGAPTGSPTRAPVRRASCSRSIPRVTWSRRCGQPSPSVVFSARSLDAALQHEADADFAVVNQ